ncbi:MAG: hypothetical protein WCO51_01830 [bacterium]
MLDSMWSAELACLRHLVPSQVEENSLKDALLFIKSTDKKAAKRIAERWYVETLLRALYSVRKDS